MAIAIVVVGLMVFSFEYQAESANITELGDAFWWAFVTMTTVGYGDHAPVTPGGRLVAGDLMVFGICRPLGGDSHHRRAAGA